MTHTDHVDRTPRFAPRLSRIAAVLALAAVGAMPLTAQRGLSSTVVDAGATVDPKLGQQAALDETFVDETGTPFSLSEHLTGQRPVILNLAYLRCPGMCGFVLNSFLDNLTDSGLEPGKDFDLWTISIDPTETPKLAHDKKGTYLDSLAKQAATAQRVDHADAPAWTATWPFLTGEKDSIDKLAQSVGWRFRKEPVSGNYDHPPSLVVLSPKGVVTRYLDARYLTPSTLRTAVVEAGEGKVGTFVERLLVSCLTFDPRTHAYSLTAMTVMRIGGLVTLFALGGMIFFLWRRERARQRLVEATP